jgi:hypothetical protein
VPLVEVGVNIPVLKECMAEEQISASQLSRELHIHRSTLSRVMNGIQPGGKALIYALQKRWPDRAQDLVTEWHEVEVTTTVSMESG